MAAQGAEETLAELEKIASGGEPADSATGKTEVTKTSGKPDGDWIPKNRFNEVITARNEQAEEAKTWRAKASEADKSIANLTAMLSSAQKAQETINGPSFSGREAPKQRASWKPGAIGIRRRN